MKVSRDFPTENMILGWGVNPRSILAAKNQPHVVQWNILGE